VPLTITYTRTRDSKIITKADVSGRRLHCFWGPLLRDWTNNGRVHNVRVYNGDQDVTNHPAVRTAFGQNNPNQPPLTIAI